MTQLSVQDYARTRGKSRTAIYKAIREGRLREAVGQSHTGHLVLDEDLADVELASNSDPAMLRDPDAIRAGQAANRDPSPGPLFAGGELPPAAAGGAGGAPAEAGGEQRSGSSLAGSRAAIAAYDARMRRLDYEERVGRLISADAMKVEIYNANRAVRDAMLAVADNVAPLAAAATDEETVRAILLREITSALRNLSETFGKPA
jgi:hypothetical protein